MQQISTRWMPHQLNPNKKIYEVNTEPQTRLHRQNTKSETPLNNVNYQWSLSLLERLYVLVFGNEFHDQLLTQNKRPEEDCAVLIQHCTTTHKDIIEQFTAIIGLILLFELRPLLPEPQTSLEVNLRCLIDGYRTVTQITMKCG